MAAHSQNNTSSTRPRARHSYAQPKARPWAALSAIAVCSVALSACMAFGNPVLWTASDQPPVSDAARPGASGQTDGGVPEKQNGTAPTEEGAVIGNYQAISQNSDENRAENIRLAAEAIDGYVIEPGATFSFNAVVGDTGSDSRYRVAAIISDEATVEGRGGGICQVSTALYVAALKGDLDIIERHAHTVAPDYAPIGLDATLSYGQLDLRIRNSKDAPVVIHAKAVGQTVDVSLISAPLPAGTTIDATSRITDRYEAADDYGSPAQYYVAESFRVFYEDGVKTSSVLLSTDIYRVPENATVILAEGSVDPSK